MARWRALRSQMGLSPLRELVLLSTVAYAVLALVRSPGAPVPGSEALSWTLMSVAMMGPLVSGQVAYVWRSVCDRQRRLAVTCFLTGYFAVWVASGLLLVPAVRWFAGAPSSAGLGAAVVASLVWSASPMAQVARNRCHTTRRLAAFGPAAAADCAGFGGRTGCACVVACWPWMLVPRLLPGWHVPGMMMIGLFLFADRVAPAAAPRWRRPPAFATFWPTSHRWQR